MEIMTFSAPPALPAAAAATPSTSSIPTDYVAAAPLPSGDGLRAALRRDGYVILRRFLEPQQLAALRAAAATLTMQARAGQYPYLRTLPKQFPPWGSDARAGIWGVQHLLHASLPAMLRDVFVRSYFDARLLTVIKALVAVDAADEAAMADDDLVLELYNLLVRPDRDFELRWHRDAIRPEATDDEERETLARRQWFAQWNTALYDDASLVVVPGSHGRPRTAAERAADPFAAELEGMTVVQMQAGDMIFYNNNILHRGVYDAAVERMTLHGSMGHVNDGTSRAVNILQHGIGEWVGEIGFEALDLPDRETAHKMRANLVKLGTQAGTVGYSQED